VRQATPLLVFIHTFRSIYFLRSACSFLSISIGTRPAMLINLDPSYTDGRRTELWLGGVHRSDTHISTSSIPWQQPRAFSPVLDLTRRHGHRRFSYRRAWQRHADRLLNSKASTSCFLSRIRSSALGRRPDIWLGGVHGNSIQVSWRTHQGRRRVLKDQLGVMSPASRGQSWRTSHEDEPSY
jgi:hypothetical protein